MTSAIRLLLVDALNLIRRVYAAQDTAEGPERVREGREASVRSLRRAFGECRPTHAVVVFDGVGPTWRHRLFPGYKAGRRPMPSELGEALPSFRKAFEELGVATFHRQATEADDVIGTLAVKVVAGGGHAIILSTDKGYLQLLGEAVTVRDHFRQIDLGPGHTRERFGVGPAELADLFALTGDSTSSIPGVPGIGPKTAAALLGSRGSLDAVLAAARSRAENEGQQPGDPLTPRLAEKLVTHAETVHLGRRLVDLATELDLGLNLREMRYRPAPRSRG